MNLHHKDVLIWAGIKPIKRGSMGDYLAALGRECGAKGLRAHLVMETPIAPATAEMLSQSGLTYELLHSDDVHHNPRLLIRYLRSLRQSVLHLHFF